MFLLILERERGRQRHQCEGETSFGCFEHRCPTGDQTCTLGMCPGIEPTTFWHMEWCSNQRSLPVRAQYRIIKKINFGVVFYNFSCWQNKGKDNTKNHHLTRPLNTEFFFFLHNWWVLYFLFIYLFF